jgi:hypothetical protein
LEDRIPFYPELQNEMAIDTCDQNFFGAVLKALVASTPKCHPRGDPRPPIPAGIQDEIRLKTRQAKRWQVTRDPAVSAEVNHLQRYVARRLNDWRNDQWSATLESLDPENPSLLRMTKRVIRVPTSSPAGHTGGIAFSDSEKAEALADSLETLFQQLTDPSFRQLLRWLTWR